MTTITVIVSVVLAFLLTRIGGILWKLLEKLAVEELTGRLSLLPEWVALTLAPSLLPASLREQKQHEFDDGIELRWIELEEHLIDASASRLELAKLRYTCEFAVSILCRVPTFWRDAGYTDRQALRELWGYGEVERRLLIGIGTCWITISLAVFGSIFYENSDIFPLNAPSWAYALGTLAMCLGTGFAIGFRRWRAGAALMWTGSIAVIMAQVWGCSTIGVGMRLAILVVGTAAALAAVGREVAPQHLRVYLSLPLAGFLVLLAARSAQVGITSGIGDTAFYVLVATLVASKLVTNAVNQHQNQVTLG